MISAPDIPPETFIARLNRPSHVDRDWLEPAQRDFSNDEHKRWQRLYSRQMDLMNNRGCSAHAKGLEQLNITAQHIPALDELNRTLGQLTGWQLVPVPMLIPDHVFLHHLANRRFPIGNFIRSEEKMTYIEEPDVFHDLFGHVPLLANHVFANYMQVFGEAGQRAIKHNRLAALSALYWYTVEFGLMGAKNELRAYGAGILSSPGELIFALHGQSPNRIQLDVERAMRTDYDITDFQQSYFVVDSFEDLFELTQAQDFGKIYANLPAAPTYASSAILETDKVYYAGTQEYRLRGGRRSSAEAI